MPPITSEFIHETAILTNASSAPKRCIGSSRRPYFTDAKMSTPMHYTYYCGAMSITALRSTGRTLKTFVYFSALQRNTRLLHGSKKHFQKNRGSRVSSALKPHHASYQQENNRKQVVPNTCKDG